MKNNYLLLVITILFAINMQAQYTLNFENCTGDGDTYINDIWIDWGCSGICYLECSSAQAHTGQWSGLIPGDELTGAFLDLGSKVFGEWGLSFWVYIPEGKEGAMTLYNPVPIGEEQPVVGDILFNPNLESPGVGVITDSALGEVSFNFPHNQWFKVVMNWDVYTGISLATWQFNVDGEDVMPIGTPYTNSEGTAAIALGGLLFSSVSSENEMYIDDIIFTQNIIGCFPPGWDDFFESMEYETGESLNNWWDDPIEISTNQAYEGAKSGVILNDETTMVNLDFNNKTSGNFEYEMFMYVPAGKEGYFSVHGLNNEESIVGDIYFNKNNAASGIGEISDSAIGLVTFSFPHDEWFKVGMNFNLSQGMNNATWSFSINDMPIISENSPFNNENNDMPSALGGVLFASKTANTTFYLDNLEFTNLTLSTESFKKLKVLLYPNPSSNSISISTTETINNISIFNLIGNKVIETTIYKDINISALPSGMYFVLIETNNGNAVQKLIKK